MDVLRLQSTKRKERNQAGQATSMGTFWSSSSTSRRAAGQKAEFPNAYRSLPCLMPYSKGSHPMWSTRFKPLDLGELGLGHGAILRPPLLPPSSKQEKKPNHEAIVAQITFVFIFCQLSSI